MTYINHNIFCSQISYHPNLQNTPKATGSENVISHVKQSSINRQKQRIFILSDKEDEEMKHCRRISSSLKSKPRTR